MIAPGEARELLVLVGIFEAGIGQASLLVSCFSIPVMWLDGMTSLAA